jgi:hypothetical protein
MAQFYTLEEAARVLGISPDELKAQAQSRKVRAFMDSGSWRFRVADIDEHARRSGMGSDPDLSLSDLDLIAQSPDVGSESVEDINLAEFQLGVASPDMADSSMGLDLNDSDSDILLDDRTLPPEDLGSSSSTILGMKPAGKRPSDSDVKLVPENKGKGASDSDVRLGTNPMGLGRSAPPSDSNVTLVNDDLDSGSSDAFASADAGETTLRPSPLLGSSDEMTVADHSDSDFELTPSSVIDALEPESGSDFELTALDDASDEFDAAPLKGPGDSDVTGAEPSTSGINLGRPSDSGINLHSVGGFNLDSADSIELAPLDDEEDDPRKKPAPKPAAKPKPVEDPGATAMPQKVDLSATALPTKADRDIFEDTDFEVDALDSSSEDRTMQLDASSDFDIEESDSASEVFAVDEDDVDAAAATAMGPAVTDDDDEFGSDSGETDSAWDVEPEPTPSQAAAAAPRAGGGASPLLQSSAQAEWGGLWVGMLAVATVFMMLLAFVGMDLIRNMYDFQGNSPASGLVQSIAGMIGS